MDKVMTDEEFIKACQKSLLNTWLERPDLIRKYKAWDYVQYLREQVYGKPKVEVLNPAWVCRIEKGEV